MSNLRRYWQFLGGLVPSLAVKLTRLASGNYTGTVFSPTPVTVNVEPTGQEVTAPGNSSFTVNFPAAGTYYLRLYAAGTDIVSYVNLDGLGVVGTEGDPDGVFDTTQFLNLTYANVTGSYVHTVRGYYQDTLFIRSTLLTSGTLNLTDVNTATINMEFNKFTGLLLPVNRDRLVSILGASGRLSGTFTSGIMPVLKTLEIGSDQNAAGRLTTINITGCTALETFAHSQNQTSSVIATAADVAKLKTWTALRCALGGANAAAHALLVRYAVLLTSLDMRENGLTGAEQEAFFDSFLDTVGSRVATGAKTFRLDGTGLVAQTNEGLVQTQERTKVASLLSALNMTVSYNRPRLSLSRLNTNTIRLTYTGTRDITIWGIGDTITLISSTNTTGLTNTTYTVLAGSGKVWDIGQTGATISNGALGTFDKI
ncbi:hypothetical protein [Hymenobacter guriensis]|uniref:Uncharacterized protein n=1 Tax=Hymenobacter guriensis TaxID=2793065 RepID=A0ABS0L0J5_9BACT|nr:hypothetical protein [Hymenobacter guriensis]MBG8553078.1 hypothetical protein [Hymenobacter guriensis]